MRNCKLHGQKLVMQEGLAERSIQDATRVKGVRGGDICHMSWISMETNSDIVSNTCASVCVQPLEEHFHIQQDRRLSPVAMNKIAAGVSGIMAVDKTADLMILDSC